MGIISMSTQFNNTLKTQNTGFGFTSIQYPNTQPEPAI